MKKATVAIASFVRGLKARLGTVRSGEPLAKFR
jgi:hypothetical protein